MKLKAKHQVGCFWHLKSKRGEQVSVLMEIDRLQKWRMQLRMPVDFVSISCTESHGEKDNQYTFHPTPLGSGSIVACLGCYGDRSQRDGF
ncbi:hypothetical protein H9L39_10164 [Fusarium oxysporum f. sp. albedinis]|nr:hypothetical protein H9L39_10164 [Fusarium oxysporum f. sp. albedinis]